jgi:hypothetical protein
VPRPVARIDLARQGSPLTDDERRVFVELIGACNPRHFVASDLPLVIAFVQATVLSQHSAGAARKDDDALARWEKRRGCWRCWPPGCACRRRLGSTEDAGTSARIKRPNAMGAISKEDRQAQLLSLMARYCELGRLLDPGFTIEDGSAAIAETKLILAEMANTKAEIDALLAKRN